MQKNFSDLPVDSKFTVNGVEYVKVPEIKVSCCRSVNAHVADQPAQRTFFAPGTPVEVNA